MLAKPHVLDRIVVLGRSRAGRALAGGLGPAGEAALLPASGPWDAAGLSRIAEATLLVLAVPDQHLSSLAARLAPVLGPDGPRPAALHLSGARDDSELLPLARLGCPTASCHPVQTFGGPATTTLEGVVFGIQGSADGREAARALVASLGGLAVEVAAADKPIWHLAAVLSSGGLVGVLGAARDLLGLCGLSSAEALAALAPLSRAAIANALERGPEAALTGPVARRDEETLSAHRRALAERDPARSALYEALVAEQERLARGGG